MNVATPLSKQMRALIELVPVTIAMRQGLLVLQHAKVAHIAIKSDIVPPVLVGLYGFHQHYFGNGFIFDPDISLLSVEKFYYDDRHSVPLGLMITDNIDRLVLMIVYPYTDAGFLGPEVFVAIGSSQRAFDVMATMMMTVGR